MKKYKKKAPPDLPEGAENKCTSQTEGSAGSGSSPPIGGRPGGVSISVVIPNYNGKYLLELNLPSVFAALNFAWQNFEKKDSFPLGRPGGASISYEVIVIDDASVDDSVVFIQQHYPDIKLLINESNKGFSPTVNKGIVAAQYELVLALNSDVKLSSDYFIEQLKYFDDPDTFGVMGKIVDLPGMEDSKIQDGAKYPRISFKGIKTTYNYIPVSEITEIWLPSFFLSGANALMNREKLCQLGGFDEIYAPYYYEDADLGIRAWRVGWKCYFEPKSICMHTASSTIGKLKPEKVKIIIERNRIIFNHLHLMGWHLRFFKYWLWLRCFIKLVKGNFIIYKAIKLFRKDPLLLEQSKQALLKVQVKTGKKYSVYETEQYISKKIESIPCRIF